MTIKPDKNLTKYAVYVFVTAVMIKIAFLFLSNIESCLGKTGAVFIYIYNLIKPFAVALIIAYLLFPMTSFFKKLMRKSKILNKMKDSTLALIAVFISYLCIIAILAGIIGGIYLMIGGELSDHPNWVNITTDVYNYFTENEFSSNSISHAISKLNLPFSEYIEVGVTYAFETIQTYISKNLTVLTSSLISIGSAIATFFIAVIISVYLLMDIEYFLDIGRKAYYLIFKSGTLSKKLKHIILIFHDTFSKFIRGQLLEAFIVGILSAIALAIAGIKYSLLIGLIAGISNLIPYVGPIVGTILACFMGILSGDPMKILWALVAMIIVQQIDNHFLAPQIVGNSVGLHPVFTMMAILIGGSMGGFIGMLIAVPVGASLKILLTEWYDKKVQTETQNKAETSE